MSDFSRFFASRGILDQFFQDRLKRLVDSSGTRWLPTSMDGQGPNLSEAVLKQIQNAAKIREAFFAGGGQTPSVQFELKPVFLDANVKAFRLNIEGQTTEYLRESTLSSSFKWPGPQTNVGVKMTFELLDGREISRSEQGPWAWLRMLDKDKAVLDHTALRDRIGVTFQADGYRVRYELRAGSVYNPFNLIELSQFRCPDSL
jgi:type VI secretion system protein ImpL